MKRWSHLFVAPCLVMIFLVACSGQLVRAQSIAPQFDLTTDVDIICSEIRDRYFYFADREGHWTASCERAKSEASRLTGETGSLNVLERLLDDLYDPHVSLDTHNLNSPRLTSDIWIEPVDGDYIIKAIRPLSGAANAGLRVGDHLVSFNSLLPMDLALTRIHSSSDKISRKRLTWAINAAIAGRRNEPRDIVVRRNGKILSYSMSDPEPTLPVELVTYRRLSSDIGYIRFNDTLGQTDTIQVFTNTLEALRDTKGLVIDMRSTPSGGSTSIAEPIMGRFLKEDSAYQITVPMDAEPYNSVAKAIGPWTYDKPLVVLVGRWTGSMGEGVSIGFEATDRATVIGSRMAGLAGGIESFPLQVLNDVSVRFPTYGLRHLDGTPRQDWAPQEEMLADNGNGPDYLLETAVKMLEEAKK